MAHPGHDACGHCVRTRVLVRPLDETLRAVSRVSDVRVCVRPHVGFLEVPGMGAEALEAQSKAGGGVAVTLGGGHTRGLETRLGSSHQMGHFFVCTTCLLGVQPHTFQKQEVSPSQYTLEAGTSSQQSKVTLGLLRGQCRPCGVPRGEATSRAPHKFARLGTGSDLALGAAPLVLAGAAHRPAAAVAEVEPARPPPY